MDEKQMQEFDITKIHDIELQDRRTNPEWFVNGYPKDQARVSWVRQQACDEQIRRDNEREAARIAAIPPADHSKRCMLSGNPEAPDHRELRADGMQKDYVVLCPEERAKGFIRPVRRSYRHVGPLGPRFSLRDLTPEEQEQHNKPEYSWRYVKYEEYLERGTSSAVGRFWTQEQLDRVRRGGCGGVTTMSIELAESWARSITFYSGSFCALCRTHFDNEEFVWSGTFERMGS